MPLTAIDDKHVLSEIVGRVEGIRELGAGLFEARISLSAATVGRDAGQLVNMLFGNTSIHDDVVLHDAEIPDERRGAVRRPAARTRRPAQARRRRPPRADLLRASSRRVCRRRSSPRWRGNSPTAASTTSRTITASPIRPIRRSRSASPPSRRRCAAPAAHYVPSITGDLDAMRAQVAIARDAGIDTVMVAPMVVGRVELPPAGRRQSRHGVPHASVARGRRAHRAAVPFRQAVPDARRRRRRLPQSRRALRLFGGDLPRDRRARARSRATASSPACRFRPAA